MSLGEFGDLWDAIDGTKYIIIGTSGFLSHFVFVFDVTKYITIGG